MQDNVTNSELHRKAGIAARKALSAQQRRSYSLAISERLLSSGFYERARIILSYSAFGAEADVSRFNEKAQAGGKILAFPISLEDGVMLAAVPGGPDAWETGRFGISAPVLELSRVLDPRELDLVIVPCTAFCGISGARIGMGGGYYDRYLPRCVNAAKVAAAFEAQRRDGIIPKEWDAPLSAVATETGWRGDGLLSG